MLELRSDKMKAKKWEKERSRRQVHIHQHQQASTEISSSGTIYGGINSRINNSIASNKNEVDPVGISNKAINIF